ncbi:hypothetical protein ACH42_17575 [Endozoicomonas sp. (ex Bugula neritina AB1)]|nr:hypothetical protein ACH42_17575 [Endozoicomonas sp. (ex Bugula neritina AB1)]
MNGDGVRRQEGLKHPDLDSFPGTDEAQQLGSQGNFKGRNVSKPRKFIQYLKRFFHFKDHKDYYYKRDSQLDISKRRIETLTSLRHSETTAQNLDEASFQSQGKKLEVTLKNPHPIISELQRITNELHSENDQYIQQDPKKSLIITKKARIKRAQTDNTIYFNLVIEKTKTPHGLVCAFNAIDYAASEKHIDEKQQNTLKAQIRTQLQNRVKLLEKAPPQKENDNEEHRQAYAHRLDDILELTTAMKTTETPLPSKQIRRLTLNTYLRSADKLEPHPESLTITKQRLDHSIGLIKHPVKNILQIAGDKSIEKQLNGYRSRASNNHSQMEAALNSIPKSHAMLSELKHQTLAPYRDRWAQLKAVMIDLQEQISNTKNSGKLKKLQETQRKHTPRLHQTEAAMIDIQTQIETLESQLNKQKHNLKDWQGFYESQTDTYPSLRTVYTLPSEMRKRLEFAEGFFSADQMTTATHTLENINSKPTSSDTQRTKDISYALEYLNTLKNSETKPEVALNSLELGYQYNRLKQLRQKDSMPTVFLRHSLSTVERHLGITPPLPLYKPETPNEEKSEAPLSDANSHLEGAVESQPIVTLPPYPPEGTPSPYTLDATGGASSHIPQPDQEHEDNYIIHLNWITPEINSSVPNNASDLLKQIIQDEVGSNTYKAGWHLAHLAYNAGLALEELSGGVQVDYQRVQDAFRFSCRQLNTACNSETNEVTVNLQDLLQKFTTAITEN